MDCLLAVDGLLIMKLGRPEFDEADVMSSASDRSSTSKVGGELRAARLRLGWQLDEVSRGLRIRLPYLEALEEGRVGDLPGAAYAVGFVRNYAQALGLDPDEIARRFRAEAQEVNTKPVLEFPAPVSERGVPAGAVVLLGLVLAVGAYAAWYKFAPNRPSDADVTAVPERLEHLAGPAASSVSPQVASILPSPVPAASPRPVSAPSAAPISAQAAPVVAPQIPVPVPVPVSLTPPPVPPPNAPMVPVVDVSRVMLRFKADSFVQVREKQGPVLLNRVMRAGETWPVPKEDNLVMLTGNAGGTEIVVDGITAAPLGAAGAVRKDVSLDPAAIKLPPGVRLPR